MSIDDRSDLKMFWAGLDVLQELVEPGSELSSEEVSIILGTRNTKGIGAALSGTRDTLASFGIQRNEALIRSTRKGKSVWRAGPRIRQANHILQISRESWIKSSQFDQVPTDNVSPEYSGPVIVLRSQLFELDVFRFSGGIEQLELALEIGWKKDKSNTYFHLGEVYVHCIEAGNDGVEHPIPDGYEENGIWGRGFWDHADPHVAGGIGTGINPTLSACVGEARWVERRIPYVNVERQIFKMRASCGHMIRSADAEKWQVLKPSRSIRFVHWMRSPRGKKHGSTPPIRMRFRCWYEIVIETTNGKRAVLREEGLRSDDHRTASRAIKKWRRCNGISDAEPISVAGFRISKKQPRPQDPPS